MKTKIIIFIISCLALVSACKKDGNLIQVNGIGASELMSSETNVILTKETSSNAVLALTWSASSLIISDNSVGIPGSVPKYIVEISATNDFKNMVKYTPVTTTYTFTGEVLNTLGKTLGFTSGVSTPMYFRINSALGDNTKSYYSNAVTVNVTCYTLDMSLGFILDSKKADTGFRLFSPNSDGEYSGFTGVASWYNWFLLEGDVTIWGNVGASGTEFSASNDQSSFWNFWYPGKSGCYYTTFSRTNKEWTATYIPSLAVSGDVTATMTFDQANVKWYVSFTTTTSNQTVKVNCSTASLYNKTTKTDDASAVAKTIGFIPHSDSTLTFDWNSASAGNITISKAGNYTLTFDLKNPKAWTYRLSAGTVVVKTISKKLYLPGIDDGLPGGKWTFNNYLRLLSEVDSTFAGVINVNSLWGYNMSLDSGEWTNVYKKGSTDGTLAFKGTSNIPAPTAGLYLIQADLKKLTYNYLALGNSIYLGGLNGNTWDFNTILTQTSVGVYTGVVSYTTTSTWGMKIYLIANDWDHYFGGSFSSLDYASKSNIMDVQSLATGTYNVTVDLINNTCSFVAK